MVHIWADIQKQLFKSFLLKEFECTKSKKKKNADPTQQDEISDYITLISDTGIYMY